MYFWASSRCRIENSDEKAAVFLQPLYIIGLKIVPRETRDIEGLFDHIRTCVCSPLKISFSVGTSQ